MRKKTRIAGLIIAGMLAVLVLLVGLMFFIIFSIGQSEPDPGSFTHEVEYRVEFQPNGTLNNTELVVPYPEDERFQSAINRDAPNVSIRNELNASLSIVNTSRGEMLKLDIGDFRPEKRHERYESHVDRLENRTGEKEISRANVSGLAEYSPYNLVIKAEYNRSLDTRNGLENEPHLQSSKAQCQSPHAGDCATTEAFVKYEASKNTHADLNVRIEGRNSWWNFGWSGNSYSQRFYNSFYDDENLVGSQDRWITLTGREEQGDGSYREDSR